jgi:hypothetical protein
MSWAWRYCNPDATPWTCKNRILISTTSVCDTSYKLLSVGRRVLFKIGCDVSEFIERRNQDGPRSDIVADADEREDILVCKLSPDINFTFEPLLRNYQTIS